MNAQKQTLWMILAGLIASSGMVWAATGSWNVDSDGNWNVDGNWSGATFPDGTAQQATLGGTITADRVITLGQDITIRNLVVNDNNRYTITGGNTLTLNRAGTQFTQSGTGGVTVDVDVILGNSGTWNGAGTGTSIFNGVISDGGGGFQITKGGASTLILNGNNTFGGGMVLNAGVVEFGDDNAAGTGTIDLSGSTVQAGGGARTIGNAITVSGNTTIAGSEDLTFSGDMTLGAGRTFTIDNTADTTFSGDISGAARLTKDGNGLLVLSGDNSYSGDLRILAGPVDFGHDNAAGTGDLLINGVTTIRAVGGARTLGNVVDINSDFTIGGSNDLTLSGDIAMANAVRTITVDNTGATTFSGVITGGGAGGLTKEGAGTLTLSGAAANTFSGATVINDGTLELNKTGALGSTASVAVNSGGTLLFSGASTDRVNNSAGVTLGGGTLTAPDVTETMGVLTLTGSSVINLGTDGGNDDLTFSNLVDSGGAVVINNWAGTQFSSGTDDRIFLTGATVGTIFGDVQFTGFAQGAIVLSTGELVPIPEPGTVVAGLILVGLVGLTWLRSRADLLERVLVRIRRKP
jgi:autotransporter-associated beta strand protein